MTRAKAKKKVPADCLCCVHVSGGYKKQISSPPFHPFLSFPLPSISFPSKQEKEESKSAYLRVSFVFPFPPFLSRSVLLSSVLQVTSICSH